MPFTVLPDFSPTLTKPVAPKLSTGKESEVLGVRSANPAYPHARIGFRSLVPACCGCQCRPRGRLLLRHADSGAGVLCNVHGDQDLLHLQKGERSPGAGSRLGRVDELSVDEARKRAVKLAGDMVQGIDPQAVRTSPKGGSHP